MDAGNPECTEGLSKKFFDYWLADVRNGFASPLSGAQQGTIKALCYAAAQAIAEQVAGGGDPGEGYLTTAAAEATYETQAAHAADLAPLETSAHATATYETQAGHAASIADMETQTHAAATYATLAGVAAGYLPLTGGTVTGGLHLDRATGGTWPTNAIVRLHSQASSVGRLCISQGGPGNFDGWVKFVWDNAGNENNWCMAMYSDGANTPGRANFKGGVVSPKFQGSLKGTGDGDVAWLEAIGGTYDNRLTVGPQHPYGKKHTRLYVTDGYAPSDLGDGGELDVWNGGWGPNGSKRWLRLNGRTGNMALGLETAPAAAGGSRLLVDGHVEVTAGNSYVLKSPNGTRYRIKVADDGTLSTEAA
jgi:hypothetical protein